MLVVYASKTGNVRRFINKIGMETVEISAGLRVDSPFVLVTYTTDFGKVPEEVLSFLTENSDLMVGVAASGNRNWGNTLFARSADTISSMYSVPVVSKFEMSGTSREIELFVREVTAIESHRAK